MRRDPSSLNAAAIPARQLRGQETTDSSTGNIAALVAEVSLIRLTGAAPVLQGIAAPLYGSSSLILLYCANAVTLNHEDGAASAANRITCDTAATIAVAAGKTIPLIYDQTSARWRPVRF